MKKILVLIPVIVLLLTSCGINIGDKAADVGEQAAEVFQNSRTKMLDKLTSEESKKITQMSTDILTCITNNDKESFKKLFCEQSRNIPDFDEQVDTMFEYCKGTVYFTENTIDTRASGGEKWDKGVRTYWQVSPEIPYFKVLGEPDPDEKKTTYYSVQKARYYSIRYSWCITYESDKTHEGLTGLKIDLLNVDSMTVGEWITLFN